MRVTKKIREKQLEILEETYRGAKPELHFRNPFELLIAVILSAQCTDKRVNITTARLFKKAATPAAIVALGISGLEEEIKDCGLFRNKAKNIMATCRTLVEEFGGEVPSDYDTLLKLPGVGRKTANVVRGNIFDIPSIVVDTHVKRISKKLGITTTEDPVKAEFELMEVLPESAWIIWNLDVIALGREICVARTPKCDRCFLADVCPSCKR